MRRTTTAILIGVGLLALAPFTITAYKAYAADAAHGASCSGDQTEGATACNVNGCFVCTSGSWVTQPLHIGASSLTCDSSHAGLMRYNNTLQYCDGTSWKTLGGASHPVYFVSSTTQVSSSAADSTKDAACTTDFGSSYQAAQLQDLGVYLGSAGGLYNIAGSSYGRYAALGTSGEVTLTTSSEKAPVACIRKDAPVLLSRTTVYVYNSIATKNAACTTDYGSSYKAANSAELAAYTRIHHQGATVVTNNTSYTITTLTATGGVTHGITATSLAPVLCVRMQP